MILIRWKAALGRFPLWLAVPLVDLRQLELVNTLVSSSGNDGLLFLEYTVQSIRCSRRSSEPEYEIV